MSTSSKKHKYSRGISLTFKTKSGRVLCATIFENRITQYSTALGVQKGDGPISFSGWFTGSFPEEEDDETPENEEAPDGFFNLESLSI